MPIRISNHQDPENAVEVAWLCDQSWRLPDQMEAFEKWLATTGKDLKPCSYSADIGFSPREDALGGGGVVSLDSMKIMLNIGMELYLSEYPEMADDENET